MIIGVSGLLLDKNGKAMGTAGSGKTTVAQHLEAVHNFASIGLMDLGKRVARDLFQFTDEQLWGDQKESPDFRYIRKYNLPSPTSETSEATPVYLTARHALQKLGTEFARECYSDLWIDNALRIADLLLKAQVPGEKSPLMYTPSEGIIEWVHQEIKGVVFHDIRYMNEATVLNSVGGKLIRVVRKSDAIANEKYMHPSEIGLLYLSDDKFDYVIHNDGNLESLFSKVDAMISAFQLE